MASFAEAPRRRKLDLNPQLSSPFYNGLIPPEIRNLIFEFALTASPPPGAQADVQEVWINGQISRSSSRRGSFRPDRLLRTCQRVYDEVCCLPLFQTEHRFYLTYRFRVINGRYEDQHCLSRRRLNDHFLYAPPIAGHQRKDLVRSIHLYISQGWLEKSLLKVMKCAWWFPKAEHIRITLRRRDWWGVATDEAPIIDPFRRLGGDRLTPSLMHSDMSTETGNVEFETGAWGTAFSQAASLKTLTMEFEMNLTHYHHMESVVAWALKWRLPLPNGRHLSTEGQPTRCSLGGLSHAPGAIPISNRVVQKCGQRLQTWTCRWKAVRDV
ncbi:hypothetical protein F4802DRAFT_567367 [Xylaria palmicola]|nr:hypothetical protein F4802DRAFT_567367 [Xylaria palmicola]